MFLDILCRDICGGGHTVSIHIRESGSKYAEHDSWMVASCLCAYDGGHNSNQYRGVPAESSSVADMCLWIGDAVSGIFHVPVFNVIVGLSVGDVFIAASRDEAW